MLWEGMAEDSREMAALVLVEFEIARVAVGATLEMVLRIILILLCFWSGGGVLWSVQRGGRDGTVFSCGEESEEKRRKVCYEKVGIKRVKTK